jgi:hypothetical protein
MLVSLRKRARKKFEIGVIAYCHTQVFLAMAKLAVAAIRLLNNEKNSINI